jgi:hypothetical protein
LKRLRSIPRYAGAYRKRNKRGGNTGNFTASALGDYLPECAAFCLSFGSTDDPQFVASNIVRLFDHPTETRKEGTVDETQRRLIFAPGDEAALPLRSNLLRVHVDKGGGFV